MSAQTSQPDSLARLLASPGGSAVIRELTKEADDHAAHLQRRHDAVAAIAAARRDLERDPAREAEVARLDATEKQARETLQDIQRRRSEIAVRHANLHGHASSTINRSETTLRATCDARIREFVDALRHEHRNFDLTWKRLAVHETRGIGWECYGVVLNQDELLGMREQLRDALDALGQIALVAEPSVEQLEAEFARAQVALDAVRSRDARHGEMR